MRKNWLLSATLMFGMAGAPGCAGPDPNEESKPGNRSKQSPPVPLDIEAAKKMGLKVEDLKVGTGQEVNRGDLVEVHYTGWLTNGKKFDSSKDGGKPFTFPLGGRRVIKGWDVGVVGMKVGGVRKLTIPPELAYEKEGSPPDIPPNATLVFEIELLGIK